MRDIGGKVAIVTGASRGLGRHIAEALFDHGVKVLVTARSAEELEAVRAGFDRTGARSLAIAGDITDRAHRARVLEEARTRFGSVDILVNNAGTDDPRRISDVTVEDVRAMYELNVIALIDMTTQALVPMLAQGSGHIVNIASVAGLAPVPYASIYSSTKHAVVGFSQSIRFELEEQGIGVSVVCPNFVSEEGLFHDNTGGETSGVPTTSPASVADAVVRAITGNRDRIIVSPPFVKATPAIVGLSPTVVARLGKLTGSYAAMQGIADRARLARQATEPGNGTAAKPRQRRPKASPKP